MQNKVVTERRRFASSAITPQALACYAFRMEMGSDLKGVLPKACFNWEDQGSLGDFEQEDFG